MEQINTEKIQYAALKEIQESRRLEQLNEAFKKYLGKKGVVSLILRGLKDIPTSKRAEMGQKANKLKILLIEEFRKKKENIVVTNNFEDKDAQKTEEWADVTIPGGKTAVGHLHPLTAVKREIMMIFQAMGFEIVEGPEVETEWYNFDALNIPKDHPARDVWDTFWLKPKTKGLLLRTHTSPVQARYMEKHRPPLRIIVPGKVFRHEATDASHEMQFYHVEGLMVDKDTSVCHFKAVIKEFFKRFFRREVKFRFRPDFFPFTEPSFEIAMTCLSCGGKGCSVCKNSGWLEVAGAGMVHPNVFKSCGLNPNEWQGWAFGFGWDRLAMMRYKIDDIRLFNSGDIRFLQQF